MLYYCEVIFMLRFCRHHFKR